MSLRRFAPSLISSRFTYRAGVRLYSSDHSESYEDINSKFLTFFKDCKDDFELKRGLNNVFSYDMVPSAEVCREALKAARRVHDFPAAIRVFDALQEKTTEKEFQAYLKELDGTRKELGIPTSAELGMKH